MEFLGIGPGELLFILVVLLVAVGPERLPGLARQAGRLLVRGRNWLQSSPDAALILRARQELEQELATLRSSLIEVQSVRDEVLGAAKQLEGSVSSLASTKLSLDEVRTIATPATGAATPDATRSMAGVADAPATAAEALAPGEVPPAPTPAESPAAIAPPAPQVKLDQWAVAREPAQPAAPYANGEPGQGQAPVPASPAAFEAIELRLQAIMTDLHALQEQLKQRGALAGDWQPPSWDLSLAGAGDEATQHDEPIKTGEAVR
jgi:sec-independent protein translocase protein TatB